MEAHVHVYCEPQDPCMNACRCDHFVEGVAQGAKPGTQ